MPLTARRLNEVETNALVKLLSASEPDPTGEVEAENRDYINDSNIGAYDLVPNCTIIVARWGVEIYLDDQPRSPVEVFYYSYLTHTIELLS